MKGIGTFLSGILIGGAVALLVAPEKGEDTRKKIKGKAEGLQKDLEIQAAKGKEKFAEMKDDSMKKVDGWKTKTEEMMENATKNVNSAVENA